MLSPVILARSAASPAAVSESVPPPIACRPGALDKAQRQRQQALLDKVRRTAVGTHSLPDGLSLSFRADAAAFVELAEWISLERRCCPFLEFALEWKQDDSVSVRLTGQPGVKEFIAVEMGISPDR
jgi:hypothetical protein